VLDFKCEQWRESGYNNWQGPGIRARFAKTVTSLLTLPSVLAKVLLILNLGDKAYFTLFRSEILTLESSNETLSLSKTSFGLSIEALASSKPSF
jgi:hypothetical protein